MHSTDQRTATQRPTIIAVGWSTGPHLCHEQHLDEVSVRHQELGDQIHIVVASGVTKLRRRGHSWPELGVEVGEVEGGALTTVVVITVHV